MGTETRWRTRFTYGHPFTLDQHPVGRRAGSFCRSIYIYIYIYIRRIYIIWTMIFNFVFLLHAVACALYINMVCFRYLQSWTSLFCLFMCSLLFILYFVADGCWMLWINTACMLDVPASLSLFVEWRRLIKTRVYSFVGLYIRSYVE